jgi:hypothetical protein
LAKLVFETITSFASLKHQPYLPGLLSYIYIGKV